MLKKVFLAFLILVVSTQISQSSDIYHTPRRIEGTFSFEMVIDRSNLDEAKDLQYWLLLPANSQNQKNIIFTSIDPKPTKLDESPQKELKIGYWNFAAAKDSPTFRVNIQFKADLYRVDFFLDPGMVPDDYNQNKDIVSRYTYSDSLAFITPEITELANELTRNVTDPFLKVRNIYRWMLFHLEHQFPISQRGTRHLFANPINSKQDLYEGDSAEYSWVFIALCRAAGVPARSVTGFLVKPGSELPHTWAEFFLPKWGWLPADPYLADSKEMLLEFSDQSDDSYYLGHIDNYHLAFYKGSSFALQPESPYAHPPFILNNQVWYAPIGVWNYDQFPNASAILMITFNALLIKKYQKPELGIEMEFPEIWLHQREAELGPYILKDNFLSPDKSAQLNCNGRKLPGAYKDIDSKEAAQLEMKALTKSNPDYRIVSDQSLKIGDNEAYQFTAKLQHDEQSVQEYRIYIAKKGYLFWLIGSSRELNFGQQAKKFQAIAKSLKLNFPENIR